jgi:hypothetical protein
MSRPHAIRWGLCLGVTLFILTLGGCSTQPKPGVTCNVSVIAQGQDGKIAPQGPVARLESAAVETVKEFSHGGTAVSLLVRKTEHGKVTLDLTFPDNVTKQVKINTGETKDILPEGQMVGLRIAVEDCH